MSVLPQKGKNCYIQGEILFNNLAAGVITGDIQYLCQKEMHAIFLDFTLILRRKRASSVDSGDNNSNHSSRSSKSNSNKPDRQGRVGSKLYIQLPNSKTMSIPYEAELKISDLIERVCMKENLDSLDYFIMLITHDNHQHGLLDYTIPKEKSVLDQFPYSSIKLCPKLIYDALLTNPADYQYGAYGENNAFELF